MAHPWHHAERRARQFGGQPEDYWRIEHWFDESKRHLADLRHRAYRHHSEGIFEAERTFGPTILNSEGKPVPTRLIGEQHVKEDLGMIPSLSDWLGNIQIEKWMVRPRRSLEELEERGELGDTPDTSLSLEPTAQYAVIRDGIITGIVELTSQELVEAFETGAALLHISKLVGHRID